jgi:hypothetical protein
MERERLISPMLDRSRLDEPKPPRRHLGACTIRGAIGGCLGVGQVDRLVARVWVVYIKFCVCVILSRTPLTASLDVEA